MEQLTKDNFEDKISEGNAVVDFWADWCGPCKMMAPHFEEASGEREGVNFFKLDVDEHGEVAQKHGIRSIPTLVFFKDGEVVESVSGAMKKDDILEKVDEILG